MALVEGLDEAVRGSARISLLLMVGQVVSTVVSALTVMAVARLLGPENYGIVTVVMVPIGLAHAVTISEDYLRGEPFVMYLGDNLLKQGVKPLVDLYEEGYDCVVGATEVSNPSSYGAR